MKIQFPLHDFVFTFMFKSARIIIWQTWYEILDKNQNSKKYKYASKQCNVAGIRD